MNRSVLQSACLLVLSVLSGSALAAAENPYLGRWALTLPGGAAGWLGIEEKEGALKGSILWSGGSVVPVQGVKVEGDALIVTRITKAKKPKTDEVQQTTETITAHVAGDDLKLTTVKTSADGKESGKADFSGHRIPPVPPTPDLSQVKYAEPIQLFNGKDLTGWSIIGKADNGWSVAEGGVLMNRIQNGKTHGNLRTDREFEDFNLKLEVRTVAKNSNSGIYLRGIYEIQVAESYGKPLDSHNMGALYSRITPSVAAEKPMNEWQTFDITLVDRHVTVILNGKTIIDNQPILGCTGGALTSDEMKPGPLMLQGDHTDIDYRNIVLRPVVK